MWQDASTSSSQNFSSRTVAYKGLGICLTGQLRGICAPEQGINQLYNRLLKPFEALGGFDVFAVVPYDDCDRARGLLEAAPVRAHVVCHDHLETPEREFRWLQEGPPADPHVCPGHYCGYVWRDVAKCARVLRRSVLTGTSYWRVARGRADSFWELFPENPRLAFADDHVIWGYALPDKQWIAMPDRFAIGPQRLMLDVYFRTYEWMLNPRNWPLYDPSNVPACLRRGHFELQNGRLPDLEVSRVRGKTWACPEASARGMAYPGPENVLEARLRLSNVTVRLRRDMCFNHIRDRQHCGLKQDSACERRPVRHRRGYWLNDWEAAPFPQGEPFGEFLNRQAGVEGSRKFESGLLHHDGHWAARLAQLMFEEWGYLGRPPRIVDLGCGRGALVEELDRFHLPIAGVDGSRLVEHTLGTKGLRADLTESGELGSMKACQHGDANKAWCHWLRGLESADWAFALDVLQDIPRARVRVLVRHLHRHGRRGVVVSWDRGKHEASARELLGGLHSAGFAVDGATTTALRQFGGLLCCPSHQDVIVMRKGSQRDAPCKIKALSEIEGSTPCIFQQSFGCVEDGIWVHLGCSAYFQWELDGRDVLLECHSDSHDYVECGRKDARAPDALQNQVWKAASESKHVIRTQLCPACPLPRTDLMMTTRWTPGSRNASQRALPLFSHVFGLPLSHLFDALDPLTSQENIVWSGDDASRSLTMAMLQAFKLSTLRGQQLAASARRWSRSAWPHVRAMLARPGGLAWPKTSEKLERLATLISSLRVAAVHARRFARRSGWPSGAGSDDASASERSCQADLPKLLQLESSCAGEMLMRLDVEGDRRLPFAERAVQFVQRGKGWYPEYSAGSPLARYLYRLSYHAPAAGWMPR